MTMQFTGSLHAEGWWDHLPPGHPIDVTLIPEKRTWSRDETAPRPALRPSPRPITMSEPSLQTSPRVSIAPRRITRSHASAWILTVAVGATGGALAVATVRDPQSMHEHLDTTLAEVKNLTSSSAPPATVAQVTALTTIPDITAVPHPVQESTPVTTAQSIVPARSPSPDAPLLLVAPAAGRSVSHPLAVTPVKQLATLAPSTPKELAEAPQVMPSQLVPVQPLALVQTQPLAQALPAVVVPLNVQPPVDIAPPPVQPPASSPQ